MNANVTCEPFPYLYINNGGEVAGFLQVVEAAHLHELSHDLVGDLVAPLVDNRHVDVVNEDAHLLTSRRSVRRAHALVHVTLNRALQTSCIFDFCAKLTSFCTANSDQTI